MKPKYHECSYEQVLNLLDQSTDRLRRLYPLNPPAYIVTKEFELIDAKVARLKAIETERAAQRYPDPNNDGALA